MPKGKTDARLGNKVRRDELGLIPGNDRLLPVEVEGTNGPSWSGRLPLSAARLRTSKDPKGFASDEFYSDKSRIVFCSSHRRMMQKAQVFSLEANTSVRNRLTHTLEVADVGRRLGRAVGRKLEDLGIATPEERDCMQTIVENACSMHDIGNPPFGHFGEEAIKKWFRTRGGEILNRQFGKELALEPGEDTRLADFLNFDGNPQGLRIVMRLHSNVDEYGLNLTSSTLLAAIKYPNWNPAQREKLFGKKLGIFSSEKDRYLRACQIAGHTPGRRYFLAYLMELADDTCYCLSDIADSFEKGIVTSRDFKEEFTSICKKEGYEAGLVLPKDPIKNFAYDIAIAVAQRVVGETADLFAANLQNYVAGTAKELVAELPSGRLLECFKIFARRFIYTHDAAQRLEIAGSKIVEGLLDHFGRLLELPRNEFKYFVKEKQFRKGSGLDIEWRIYNQLSERMLSTYEYQVKNDRTRRDSSDLHEWICRARLIVDHVSGLTDHSARDVYQNLMGISV